MNDRHGTEIPELAALPRTIEPAAALEDRIVAAMYERGALRRRRRMPAWLAAAAAITAFAGGVLIGRETAPVSEGTAATPSSVQAVPGDVPPGTTVTWF